MTGIKVIFPKEIDGHPKQIEVWKSDSRFLSLLWGRRAGKDWIASRKAIKNSYRDLKHGINCNPNPSVRKKIPRLHYWAVAPTYALSKTQIMYFLSVIPDELIIKNNAYSSSGELWLEGDILWEFKSAERPERLVSVGLNGIYITETARLKPTVWNDNLRPTLTDKGGWSIDTTTPIGHNWYVTQIWKYADRKSPDKLPECHGIFCESVENTKVPALQKDIEMARKTMPSKYFKRNYEACIDAFHGQIYDDFDSDIHVQNFEVDLSRYELIYAGMDWGYNHEGGFVVIGIDKDGNVDVIFENIQSRILAVSQLPNDDTWMKRVKTACDQFKIEYIYCGVDEPAYIQAFRSADIPARKCDNAVLPGIQFVSTLIQVDDNGVTRFRIHRGNCPKLARQLPTYAWAEKEGDLKEEPLKVNDDAVDMLRYAIYSAKRHIRFIIDENSNTINKHE